MTYEWDEAKRKANIAKHRVDFKAMENFGWESALVDFDGKEEYGEDRWLAIGLIGINLYVVSFAERGENIRVISLRKATKAERVLYDKK